MKPMLLTSGPLRPDSDSYAFEVNWDGLIRRPTVLTSFYVVSVEGKARQGV